MVVYKQRHIRCKQILVYKETDKSRKLEWPLQPWWSNSAQSKVFTINYIMKTILVIRWSLLYINTRNTEHKFDYISLSGRWRTKCCDCVHSLVCLYHVQGVSQFTTSENIFQILRVHSPRPYSYLTKHIYFNLNDVSNTAVVAQWLVYWRWLPGSQVRSLGRLRRKYFFKMFRNRRRSAAQRSWYKFHQDSCPQIHPIMTPVLIADSP